MNQAGECEALRYTMVNVGSWSYGHGLQPPSWAFKFSVEKNGGSWYSQYHVNWESKPCLQGLTATAQGCTLTKVFLPAINHFSLQMKYKSIQRCKKEALFKLISSVALAVVTNPSTNQRSHCCED